jgi:hypothetical protein
VISGPDVGICDACTATVTSNGEAVTTAHGRLTPVPVDADDVACSFCGQRRLAVASMVALADIYVCSDCVSLCEDIIHAET